MTEHDNGVAVIGLAARFPRAAGVRAFWSLLTSGTEALSRFDDDTLAHAGIRPLVRADDRYVPVRGILENVEDFDAEFFGFTPLDARLTDPQHRLFLELCWEALEDGASIAGAIGGRVGVYGGTGTSDYARLFGAHDRAADHLMTAMLLGNDKDYFCTQASYRLDLRGPSVSVQTACSTGLVATHLAVQSLLLGECDLALAGAVSLMLPQHSGYRYEEGGLFSADGRIRAFDAAANGTVFSNGGAVVLLKRSEDALRDRDPIRAVVRGSAINNDGRARAGFAAPSAPQQAAVIREALASAGLSPNDIGHVEANASGSSLADAIELRALGLAFAGCPPKRCSLGAVKPNVGHLGPVAGLAALIKAVLALEHRYIPPTLNVTTPSGEFDSEGPFALDYAGQPWGERPLRAGVSAFGIGGTNAHVVLEAAPTVASTVRSNVAAIVVSARSAAALLAQCARLADDLDRDPERSIADVAYTLQTGRRHFAFRRAIVCNSAAQASAMLRAPHDDPARVSESTHWHDLAAAYRAGVDVDWEAAYAHGHPRRLSLPTYPFERHRHWIETAPPVHEAPRQRAERSSEPPTPGALERCIGAAWCSNLGRNAIAPSERYFDLGGTSLHIPAIRARIEAELRIDVPLRLLLENLTLAQLSDALIVDLLDDERIDLADYIARLDDHDSTRLLRFLHYDSRPAPASLVSTKEG